MWQRRTLQPEHLFRDRSHTIIDIPERRSPPPWDLAAVEVGDELHRPSDLRYDPFV